MIGESEVRVGLQANEIIALYRYVQKQKTEETF
jgi:hypothetical protein